MSMNSKPEPSVAGVKALTVLKTAPAKTLRPESDAFRAVIKKYDEEQAKLREESARQQAINAKARLAKRDRDRRINEIYGLMAHYKRKLAISPNDPATEAALSELKTKLFWLMFGI